MNQLPNELVWILMALFGGLARYFDTYLKLKEKFSFSKLIATLFVCAFSGFLCAQVAILIYPQWATAASGFGGYAGVEAIPFMIAIIKSKLTIGNKK